MKTAFFIVIAIFAILGLLSTFQGCGGEITREEFQTTHKYLNERIDTMQVKLDEINFLVTELDQKVLVIGSDVKDMKFSIDTLKAGQLIIYQGITNLSQTETQQNWAGKLIDWLN